LNNFGISLPTGLLNDVFAIKIPIAQKLKFLLYFKKDTNMIIWKLIAGKIQNLRSKYFPTSKEASIRFKRYIKELTQEIAFLINGVNPVGESDEEAFVRYCLEGFAQENMIWARGCVRLSEERTIELESFFIEKYLNLPN
jgi:hypothetical protein